MTATVTFPDVAAEDIALPGFEVVGLQGSEWHILPQDDGAALNATRAACGATLKANTAVICHWRGAEAAVEASRSTANQRRLCEACKVSPERTARAGAGAK